MREPAPVVLSGDVVRLEPLSQAHCADLFAAAQDEEVWEWLPLRRPRSEDDVREMVRRHPGTPAWAVLHEGHAIGSTSYLDVDLSVGGLEVGWTWYARPLWKTAVNPECKLLVLGHAFEDLGAERVLLKTDAGNARSRGAIERLGAQYDGTLRHNRRRPDGSVRDTAYFSILAAEWPGVRDRLRIRLRLGDLPGESAASGLGRDT